MHYVKRNWRSYLLALAATTPVLYGQSDAAPEDETIMLNEFTVNSSKDTSYSGRQALSTTRTGVDLLDLPQSVTVLNRNFIDEVNPAMLGDLLKYVGGAQTGNLNFSVDRFMLRGFTGESDYQDGFRASQSESQADLSVVDRMEVIKGPAAIFIANGPVGGVINKISKSPVSYKIATLKVQAGLWDANRAELDLGGAITGDKRLQYRLVVAGQYSDGWYDRTYVHRVLIAPSLAYDFSSSTRLTFRYQYVNTDFSAYNGIPFDLRTNRVLAVSDKFNASEDEPRNFRTDKVHKLTAEFTSRLNDVVSIRLAGLFSTTDANRVESILTAIPANYTGGPVNRSTTAIDNEFPRRTVQNDFVFNFGTGPITHKLLTGWEFTDNTTQSTTYAGTSSQIDPFNPVFPGTVTVNRATPTNRTKTLNEFGKIFFLETATLFDRVIVSFGGSRNIYRTQATNRLTGAATSPLLTTYQNLGQGGVVFKVTKTLSVFYGYNENFAPNVLNGQVLPSQQGKQHEVGLKTELIDGRLTANIAYFDIKQLNLTVPAFPQTTPPSFVLVAGENSKGVDGDLTWTVTSNIDVLASFAVFDAKVPQVPPNNTVNRVLPVGNVSEHTYGIWTRYSFKDGQLKGFSMAAGLNYQSKKAITNNANTEFYGYAPGRTLLDLQLNYVRGRVRYSLNVDNLLDEDYVYAARSFNVVIPGSGTNLKAAITYTF